MAFESRTKAIIEFLEELDKKNLIYFNSELWNTKFTKNFGYRTPIFAYVFHRILEQYDEGKIGFRTTDEAIHIFVFTNIVNFITSNLEFVKKVLSVLIDKDKIKLDKNTTYGKLIRRICTKLEYDGTRIETMLDNFFVGFRNGTSHIQYAITKNGVSVDINGQTIHFDSEKLNQMMDETSAIVNVFEEFGNKKTTELEIQEKSLNMKTKELNRQVNQVANENAERNRKTAALRSETKRIERKIVKTERKREMINRKITRKKKTTVRITPKSKNYSLYEHIQQDSEQQS